MAFCIHNRVEDDRKVQSTRLVGDERMCPSLEGGVYKGAVGDVATLGLTKVD